MDVWQLYLSGHNGRPPRNAFDLVNFSRSTDSTLTFSAAKQLYQQRTHNISLQKEAFRDLSVEAPKRKHPDGDGVVAILRSPKTGKKAHAHARASSKASVVVKQSKSKSSSRRTSRHNSKHSKHDYAFEEEEEEANEDHPNQANHTSGHRRTNHTNHEHGHYDDDTSDSSEEEPRFARHRSQPRPRPLSSRPLPPGPPVVSSAHSRMSNNSSRSRVKPKTAETSSSPRLGIRQVIRHISTSILPSSSNSNSHANGNGNGRSSSRKSKHSRHKNVSSPAVVIGNVNDRKLSLSKAHSTKKEKNGRSSSGSRAKKNRRKAQSTRESKKHAENNNMNALQPFDSTDMEEIREDKSMIFFKRNALNRRGHQVQHSQPVQPVKPVQQRERHSEKTRSRQRENQHALGAPSSIRTVRSADNSRDESSSNESEAGESSASSIVAPATPQHDSPTLSSSNTSTASSSSSSASDAGAAAKPSKSSNNIHEYAEKHLKRDHTGHTPKVASISNKVKSHTKTTAKKHKRAASPSPAPAVLEGANDDDEEVEDSDAELVLKRVMSAKPRSHQKKKNKLNRGEFAKSNELTEAAHNKKKKKQSLQIKVEADDSSSTTAKTHKSTQKRTARLSKTIKKKNATPKTKVKRSISADPQSILNGIANGTKKLKSAVAPQKFTKRNTYTNGNTSKGSNDRDSNGNASSGRRRADTSKRQTSNGSRSRSPTRAHTKTKTKPQQRTLSAQLEPDDDHKTLTPPRAKLTRIYSGNEEKRDDAAAAAAMETVHSPSSVTSSSRSRSHSPRKRAKFRVGDVVQVSLKIGDTKRSDLARIRYVGCVTALDSEHDMYGIECFKLQFNAHRIGGQLVHDGSIENGAPLFAVKKAGYGTFIKSKGIQCKKSLWSLKRSTRELQLKLFDAETFIAAAKYGSVKVVKHLFTLLLSMNKQPRAHTPKAAKRNGRDTRSESQHNILNEQHLPRAMMQTIQTGFGLAVKNNQTKVVKIVLMHCGSNHVQMSLSAAAKAKREKRRRSKDQTRVFKFENNGNGDGDDDEDIGEDDGEDEDDDDMDVFGGKLSLLQSGGSKFYTADLFDTVCAHKNFAMLRLLIRYDSWPLLSPHSRGLHDMFRRKGSADGIRSIVSIFPYIVNMPLLSKHANSTMLHTAILYERMEYVQYMLEHAQLPVQLEFDQFVDEKQEQVSLPVPILLLAIVNTTLGNIKMATTLIRMLLSYGANLSWFPKVTLKQQQHLLTRDHDDDDDEDDDADSEDSDAESELPLLQFDAEYTEQKLLFYSVAHPNMNTRSSAHTHTNKKHRKYMVFGSMLAGLLHKFVDCYKLVLRDKHTTTTTTYDKKYALEHLSEILSLFMLYGIDFEHNEFQHVWMEYDCSTPRWNIQNFPYNVCSAKNEFVFLQKVFKKSLKKYPVKLLSVIRGIFEHNELLWFDDDLAPYLEEIVDLFQVAIIPYSMYDALIFESMHYYAPYSPEVSSPESADFMFAYQRSPNVE